MTPTLENIDLLIEARWIATVDTDLVLKNHAVAVNNGRIPVSYTHLRAHETVLDLVCRLLLEKKNNKITYHNTHVTHHCNMCNRL